MHGLARPNARNLDLYRHSAIGVIGLNQTSHVLRVSGSDTVYWIIKANTVSVKKIG